MEEDFQKRVTEAVQNPENRGEMANADAVGTVGNADCGDMLRVWIKYKEEDGRKVIDRASFQSFGCETAIAAASLAMEMIRGKTPGEALQMSGQELAADLGPLPPTKVHCTALVEGALRSALEGSDSDATRSEASRIAPKSGTPAPTLMDSLSGGGQKTGGVKVVFLPPAGKVD
jgi:nitrogen fixation NifU-like protein